MMVWRQLPQMKVMASNHSQTTQQNQQESMEELRKQPERNDGVRDKGSSERCG